MTANDRRIQFFREEFTAVYAGESIQLLPKEYALFEFLYHNRNQIFSREDLLNRVWPLEEPSDRTVDDHIYRLRKKLKKWDSLFTIDTVRGYGYRLSQKEPHPMNNPLLQDSEFVEGIYKLFNKYHGMGMGAAMQTLAANQDVLGIQIDPFYRVYVRFVVGDFHWIVDTNELPFWEKAPYLLHLYVSIEQNAEKAMPFVERVLQKRELLSARWQQDFDLNLIGLYLESGRLEQAVTQFQAMQPVIAAMNSSSFTMIFLVKQLYVSIYTDDQRLGTEAVEAAEALLQKAPIQRELGIFTVAKGIWMYTKGNTPEARQLLEDGIEVLKRTRFVPHLISGLRHILLFLNRFDLDPETKRRYQQTWHQLADQYQFDALNKKIHRLLQANL